MSIRISGLIELVRPGRWTSPRTASARATDIANFAKRLQQLMRGRAQTSHVIENSTYKVHSTLLRGYGPIKRPDGRFHQYILSVDDQWSAYEALVNAPISEDTFMPVFDESRPVFLRIDSGCTSGQLLKDDTCECGEQLEIAIGMLADCEQGLIIRIPSQDGRGMGQPFKLATLALQDKFGLDTFEATIALSPDGTVDRRTYSGAISVLQHMGVSNNSTLHFATNNPLKETVLEENGYHIGIQLPVHAPRTPGNTRNLEAKKCKLGHRL